MRIESVPKNMGLKYDIFVIGNNGPDIATPEQAGTGGGGTDGTNANCNWASHCDTDCTNGGWGGTGVAGKNGSPQANDNPISGNDVAPATITIKELIGGDLWLFTAGGNGGTAGGGGKGGTGGVGGKGGSGSGCPSGTHSCGGCQGGTGGTGGTGGNGGISGDGGNGNTVNITYSSKTNSIYYTAPQSAGGKLPLRGSGGPGGGGGSPSGNAGPGGGEGSDGVAGNTGNPSIVNVVKK